ncbi:HAMP domain-containing protein [Clostridium sp. PL3]|uniref:histidine kinase n=1 Tax=Clostridium thailandense TaxID=2794346 RepID=A0A949U1V4_9CLOT|nr:HAMP domain-containing sensor histidine kinase [Clostridium thailandense]MBV7274948.1 HAMP domain-containing protein [Clostridium thailandense]
MNLKKINFRKINFKNMNRSITLKLFIVTALVFIIFISSTLTIQSLFFGKFYISKKKSDLQNGVERLRSSYNKSKDDQKTVELIKDFEDINNAKVVILTDSGKSKFVIRPGSEKIDNLRVRLINDLIKNWTAKSDVITNIKTNNKPMTIITERKLNETRYIISVVPNNSKDEIMFAVSSLQPVSEASSVIKEFYLYFFIGAIFLIIILSLIYSNMVTEPLVKLNETASKMANLDFTQKCDISRQDEIGNLANTLDFLSENLNESLTSLKKVNIKLAEDIEKERKIEKMRKEFVAAVSHELKTPISLIGGYAEGLKDDIFEENEKEYYIDVIIDESKKMGNLVADMLDLSQLESGSFKLVKEEFFIDELIKTTMKKFLAVVNDKNIRMDINVIEKVKVFADWTRMEQVITNFITNAIRYTDENGNIVVSMEEIGDEVSVSVENTGKPIPKEEIDKIWNNFYKVDKSRARKLGGTGIGLAIVKSILDLHHGEYGVKNTETGVKFYFIIKRCGV